MKGFKVELGKSEVKRRFHVGSAKLGTDTDEEQEMQDSYCVTRSPVKWAVRVKDTSEKKKKKSILLACSFR